MSKKGFKPDGKKEDIVVSVPTAILFVTPGAGTTGAERPERGEA